MKAGPDLLASPGDRGPAPGHLPHVRACATGSRARHLEWLRGVWSALYPGWHPVELQTLQQLWRCLWQYRRDDDARRRWAANAKQYYYPREARRLIGDAAVVIIHRHELSETTTVAAAPPTAARRRALAARSVPERL